MRRAIVSNPVTITLIRVKARQLSRKPGFSRSDQDDLAQELTLRLLEKAHLYDPGRGASINTYADRVITSAVRMILRERRRLKRAAGFTALSLDTTPIVAGGKAVSLSEILSAADRERITLTTSRDHDEGDLNSLAGIIESLPSDLADIARRLSGGTVASVARDLGVSRRQVYRAMARIREHFADAGLGES